MKVKWVEEPVVEEADFILHQGDIMKDTLIDKNVRLEASLHYQTQHSVIFFVLFRVEAARHYYILNSDAFNIFLSIRVIGTDTSSVGSEACFFINFCRNVAFNDHHRKVDA